MANVRIVSQHAFTLIELLIAAGLLLIIAVIAVPNFSHSSPNPQQNTPTNSSAVGFTLTNLPTGGDPNELDSFLEHAPWGKIAYQIPKSIPLTSNAIVSLKLSPKKTFEEIGRYFETNHPTTFKMAKIQLGKKMRASFSSESETLKIIPIENEVQPISYITDTTWSWFISAKKPGRYWLHLKIEVLVTIDGQDLPYPLETYNDFVMVEATRVQRISLFISDHWEWVATALAIPTVTFVFHSLVQWFKKRRRKMPKKISKIVACRTKK